jgi:chloramphenicol-sensitive protein RarD
VGWLALSLLTWDALRTARAARRRLEELTAVAEVAEARTPLAK